MRGSRRDGIGGVADVGEEGALYGQLDVRGDQFDGDLSRCHAYLHTLHQSVHLQERESKRGGKREEGLDGGMEKVRGREDDR